MAFDLFGEFDLAQAQGLDGDLGAPGGVNLAGMPGKQAPKKVPRRPFATNIQGEEMFGHPSQQGFVDMMGPGAQGMMLQGAADDATGNIARENASRVAQLREMRRMEHEKEMMRMQLAARQQDDEGAIIRSLLMR